MLIKRQRRGSNPCGQSPLDFKSNSLTSRTHCHTANILRGILRHWQDFHSVCTNTNLNKTPLPGLEPGIFALGGRRVIHCATEAAQIKILPASYSQHFPLQKNEEKTLRLAKIPRLLTVIDTAGSKNLGARFRTETLRKIIITLLGICQICYLRKQEVTTEVILFEYSRQL